MLEGNVALKGVQDSCPLTIHEVGGFCRGEGTGWTIRSAQGEKVRSDATYLKRCHSRLGKDREQSGIRGTFIENMSDERQKRSDRNITRKADRKVEVVNRINANDQCKKLRDCSNREGETWESGPNHRVHVREDSWTYSSTGGPLGGKVLPTKEIGGALFRRRKPSGERDTCTVGEKGGRGQEP